MYCSRSGRASSTGTASLASRPFMSYTTAAAQAGRGQAQALRYYRSFTQVLQVHPAPPHISGRPWVESMSHTPNWPCLLTSELLVLPL